MDSTDFRLFPEAASTVARPTDELYLFLIAVTTFFTLAICAAILYFGAKYRRGSQVSRANPPKSMTLEITWSVIPLIIVMIIFFWGARLFYVMQRIPDRALPIQVFGKQWMWKLQHPGGRREINTLHVPVGRPVRLQMISEDVIHSFFIPAFRVKQDVLPGRYTTLWFEATRVGEFHLFCAEYCGAEHSQMIGRVVVMEPMDYAVWTSESTGESAEILGARLFERYQCGSCHFAESTRAPSLAGVFGSTVTLNGGRQVIADSAYLRESIVDPQAKVVAGFRPLMPSFETNPTENQTGLTEEDISHLIAYLQSLSTESPQPETEER